MTPAHHVPLIAPDLPEFEAVAPRFREILQNGRVTNFGRYVREFEEAVGAYVDAEAVTTSSGTMALLFTLQALELPAGAPVIMPSFTFMATAQAVRYAGGRPLFAEVGDDLTLDLDDVALLLDRHPDVAALIPVHMYGLPVDAAAVDALLADRPGPVPVVYDAAHAFGASRAGRPVGTGGQAEVFSLSVTKALVTVEGGVVTTRDGVLAERLRRMRNYGIEADYEAWYPGLNGKMSEFHAIVGLANLERLEERLTRRGQLAAAYGARLREEAGLEPLMAPPGVRHTYKDFTVLLPAPLAPRRAELMRRLADAGVETRAYFHPPVHEQKLFRAFADRPLPATERLARAVLTLPFFTAMTEADVDHVVRTLARLVRELT